MAPQYTLDLSGYKPSLSDTVPDGRYLAIVEDYELTKAKASGNDMFVVWLRILEGPSSGSVIIDRLTTTGKGLFKIVGFLNGLGAPTPKRRLSINPEGWKNKKVYIDTSKSEPYRGRPGTSQVDGYARYIPDADAEVPVLEQLAEEPAEAVAEPVVAATISSVMDGEVQDASADEPAPAEDVKEFTTGETSVAERVRTAAAPAKTEPETLSLADINL